jgi:hypothetical protein
MTNLRTSLGVLAATAAVTAGGLGTAAAATHSGTSAKPAKIPCAMQQAQVDRAQAKLILLTAKFQASKQVIKAEKLELTVAKGHKKQQVKKALAGERRMKAKAAKAKKAQVQRVAHATARLDKCLASHPGSTPTTSPSGSASTSPSTSPSDTASSSASASPSA